MDHELLAASAGYVRDSFVMASLGQFSEFEYLEKILLDAVCSDPVSYEETNDSPRVESSSKGRGIQNTKRSPTNQSLTMKSLNESRFFALTIGLNADDQGNSIPKEV